MRKQKRDRWEVPGRTGRKNTRASVEDVLDEELEEHPIDYVLRERLLKDFKAFYMELIAQDVKDKKTKLTRRQSLGKLHDLVIDFMNLDEASDVVRYSNLANYLPARTDKGEFHERWIYLRSMDKPPEVQDGPEGPISKMFYEQFWQGIVMRLKGDGLTKSVLIPRGHIKSSLCTQAYTLWKICRDPSERHLLRSGTCHLSRSFISDIKFNFEQNERFQEVFGDLGPPTKRETAWNADFIQVRAKERRGKEPTLSSMGMESEITGGHFDSITLDDVVGETNTKTPEMLAEGRRRIQRMQAVRDPGTPLLNIGTRWEEDDSHAMFIAKDSDMADDCSFIIATVLDAENKPIWPEKFNLEAISRIRRAIPEDKIWFGQYFNQFSGTSARTFHPDWIRNYEGIPEEVAKSKKLDIYIGIDTASGLSEQKGSLDFSAAVVLGQTTPDRLQYYLLDGFKEKLQAQEIAKAIVDLAMRWKLIAASYGGTFSVGVEETAYTSFLYAALDYEIKARGVESYFKPEGLKHDKRAKIERIRVMAAPYSERRILWPNSLFIPRVKSDPYDLVAAMKDEFSKYPSVAHDDLLDAHAYAYQMAVPRDYHGPVSAEQIYSKDKSIYYREQALKEASQGLSLGEFDKPGQEWGMV